MLNEQKLFENKQLTSKACSGHYRKNVDWLISLVSLLANATFNILFYSYILINTCPLRPTARNFVACL